MSGTNESKRIERPEPGFRNAERGCQRRKSAYKSGQTTEFSERTRIKEEQLNAPRSTSPPEVGVPRKRILFYRLNSYFVTW